MFNSGGKNVWRKAGYYVNPKNTWDRYAGGDKVNPVWAAPELFKYAEPQMQKAFAGVDELGKYLAGPAQEMYQNALRLTKPESDQELYNLEARRYREQMQPQLAAMGLATSGPGIDVLGQGLQDLGVKFGERSFERQAKGQELLQQATQGLALLKSLPIELQQRLIQTILQQQGYIPGYEKSLFEKMYPGGMPNFSIMGSGTSSGTSVGVGK